MKLKWLYLSVSLLFVLFFYKNVNASSELNLARTTLATVDASSVNGNRGLSNRYYGVLNLFDKGENLVNNIGYDYWYTDSALEHWIELVFIKPVTVTALNVDKARCDIASPSEADIAKKKEQEQYAKSHPIHMIGGWPPSAYEVPFSVQVETDNGIVKKYSAKDGKLVFDPELKNVTKIKFLFHPKGGNPTNIKVSEIQVFGYPPNVPYEEQKPNIRLSDEDALKSASDEFAECLSSIQKKATHRIEQKEDSKIITYSINGIDIFLVNVGRSGDVQSEAMGEFGKTTQNTTQKSK